MNPEPGGVQVILNPAASGGMGARVRPRVLQALSNAKLEFHLVETKEPGHALDAAREATKAGVGSILVVGGDGTLHEVANGILGCGPSAPSLALLPVGTGNDFHRMLGPRPDARGAVELLRSGTVKPFDVGRAEFNGTSTFFVNLLGVGIDVEVLERRARFSRVPGMAQYLLAFTSALATFHAASFRVSFSGREREGIPEVIEDRTILAAVTVGPSVGGGFFLNPEARPDDGLLDLFFVRTLGMWKIARYIPKVIRGTHGGVPEFFSAIITSAEVMRSDNAPFFFEMDGEHMREPTTHLEIEVCPGLLPVLVPEVGK